MQLKDLKAGVRFTGKALLKEVQIKRKKDGDLFAHLQIQDGHHLNHMMVWKVTEQQGIQLSSAKGKVLAIKDADVNPFNDQLQLTVNDMKNIKVVERQNDDKSTWSGTYLVHAPVSSKVMRDYFQKQLKEIKKVYPEFDIIINYIMKHYAHDFLAHPAAKSMHHSFLGGLAYHEYRMLKDLNRLQNPKIGKPLYHHVDINMDRAAIILHDIGKTKEMGTAENPDYTILGTLSSHITICFDWIKEACDQNGIDSHQESIELLRHIILAHHGRKEWGSPVVPATEDAMLVHLIDLMDSHMEMFEEAYVDQDANTLGNRNFGLQNVTPFKKPENPDGSLKRD
ncbi:putative CMP-binding factor [Philodulcilactobacillus myokoensis]|uniref:CMP-binding factor n=1 Tax=Philodulcilactobacillus myokoensis TaxID=2929573 RepID=A0A9W6ESY5_9LACO|nr:HD domain-containing protein [Philodulcilactobacillus myokoensis]GLB47541.1 putative CMP-binding factor [Philodulcilactobacillus myokoensis]